jgi:hypothetical protein
MSGPEFGFPLAVPQRQPPANGGTPVAARVTAADIQRRLDGFSASPVSVADIQRRLREPGSFKADLDSRTNADLADFNATINDVRAHPKSLMNAPHVLAAVARLVPNAFGLAPAAGLDQVTGPVVRNINRQTGSRYSPHYVTDQLLNAAGLLAGTSELSAAGKALGPGAKAATMAPEAPAAALAPSIAPEAAFERPVAEDPEPPPQGLEHLPGDIQAVPDGHWTALADQKAHESSTRPPVVDTHYTQYIGSVPSEPVLANADFVGYTGKDVKQIREVLADRAEHYRVQGAAGEMVAAQADQLKDLFTDWAGHNQPEFGKWLGIDTSRPGGAGNVVNLGHYFPMSEDRLAFLSGGSPVAGAAAPANDLADTLIPPTREYEDYDPATVKLKADRQQARDEMGDEFLSRYREMDPAEQKIVLMSMKSLLPGASTAPLPDGVIDFALRKAAATGEDVAAANVRGKSVPSPDPSAAAANAMQYGADNPSPGASLLLAILSREAALPFPSLAVRHSLIAPVIGAAAGGQGNN